MLVKQIMPQSKAGILGFHQIGGFRNLVPETSVANAIAPGFIETEMTGVLDEAMVQQWRDSIPLKRGGTPEDVANLTLFLASSMSALCHWVRLINVDGGMLT